MTARFKSHILKREERGLFGLTFERLMAIGGGGFAGYVLAKALQLTGIWMAPPILIGLAFTAYWLSEPDGVPRYLSFFAAQKALLLLAARKRPQSLRGLFVKTFAFDTQGLLLDGENLYWLEDYAGDSEMDGIEILELDELNEGGYEILNEDLIILED